MDSDTCLTSFLSAVEVTNLTSTNCDTLPGSKFLTQNV